MEPSSPTPLYQSLTIHPLSEQTTALGSLCRPKSPVSPLGCYTVFRNEIRLSLDSDVDDVVPSTLDFLSVDSEDDVLQQQTSTSSAQNRNNDKKVGPQPNIETGWFRGSKFKSPMLQLHKEIVDFAEFLSPTDEEELSRKIAVEGVTAVIKHVWPHCTVEVFGSFRTGLYLPTSDIDMVILGSGMQNIQAGLRALSKVLSWKGIAKQIQVIGKARVPIIKFVEKRSGISFDVSFDAENGPVAADFIKDVVSKWSSLRPLCLILKVFLQQRELNEVFTGGVGSYALLTMLMTMLKSLSESEFPLEQNLGVLLVRFFDFYGRKLNNNDVGISCREGESFFSKRRKGFMNENRPSLIAIEDPQTPDNDIGKNSYNYFQIRSAFAMAFSTLTNPKTILSLGPVRSILGTIIRADALLLSRKGGANGEVSFKTLLPGAGEPLDTGSNDQMQAIGKWNLEDDESLPRGGRSSKNGAKEKHKRKRFNT